MQQPPIKQLHIVLVLAALLGGMAAAPVMAAVPCCAIVAIDARSGVVTVQNVDTGRSYQVKVGDSGALSALKVGQKVNLEISAGKVTLRPAEPVGIRGRQLKAITGTIVGRTGDWQSPAQPAKRQASAAAPKNKPGGTAAPNRQTTTRQLPRVEVTSEGSTPASTRAVRNAFRAVAAQPAVKAATRAEILRQLRTNRPVAFIAGRWVTPIDLGPLYAAPTVRAAMVAQLGSNGPGLVDGAVIDPDRLGLAFTPSELGSMMLGDMAKDITASMAADALRANMTGIVGVDDIVVVAIVGGAVLATIFISEYIHHSGGSGTAAATPPPYDPTADADGDGLQNYKDDDDDGDGHDDEVDEYPDDPNRNICDCGWPNAVYFGTGVTPTVAAALHTALDVATSRLGSAINVGAAPAGRRAAMLVVLQ
ncbi:MAG TPA: hypothetical protein VFG91_01335 [Woeseiaceae bacterium]|nr:hypothetical protein [Woeseiaceae bacterium]